MTIGSIQHASRLTLLLLMAMMWLLFQLPRVISAQLLTTDDALPASPRAESVSGDSPLAIRQERVRRLMQEIPPKLLDLSRGLESIEPQRARRLQEVISRLQQMRMDQQMDEIARLLASEKLDAAGGKQQKILTQIQEIIDLLLAEDTYIDPALAEWTQLEAWRKAVEAMIDQQSRLQKELAEQQGKSERLRELDALAAGVESLLERQRALQHDTQTHRIAQPAKLAGLAPPQYDLAHDTNQQADASPHVSDATRAALAQAEQAQTQAGDQLSQGRGKAAAASQQQAIASLEKAWQALREDRQRLARLPDRQIDLLAPRQDQLAQQAADLEKQMGTEGQGSASSEGQAAVGKAQQAMQQAGAQLRGQQPHPAAQAQAEARRQLEEARERLEERLTQLRKQTMEERLAGLEVRFRWMLDRQRPVTAGTRELSGLAPADWSRAQVLTCATLAQQQSELATLAQQCMDVLRDDGTTVVIPYRVQQLEKDMLQAGQWLSLRRTDISTSDLQQEIEQTLEDLLVAVQTAREHLQQQAAQSNSLGEPSRLKAQALAPPSAELQLLKAAQIRINQRTVKLDHAISSIPQESSRKEALARLARMQQETAALAKKVAEAP